MAAPSRVLAEYTGLFPDATLVTQSGAGHYPLLDSPARFTATVAAFLAQQA